jgi:hypothetical protein
MHPLYGRESIGWLFSALCYLGLHGLRRHRYGYSRGCNGCARLLREARHGPA